MHTAAKKICTLDSSAVELGKVKATTNCKGVCVIDLSISQLNKSINNFLPFDNAPLAAHRDAIKLLPSYQSFQYSKFAKIYCHIFKME